jgi:hypothetical protein
MVEGHRDTGERSARRRLDFSFNVNMAGPLRCCDDEKGASPHDQPQKGEKKYITEEQVRHVRYKRQYELEDEEYEHRTGKSLKKCEDSRNPWHCPFLKHC